MVSVTEDGDYKIVTGTASEVLTEVKNDGVSRKDFVGFHHDTDSDMTVMYENS